MRIHLDIETGDPDDLWMLAVAATHPKVELTGVTVYPGGLDQVGLVRAVLDRLGRSNVPVGARGLQDGKTRVTSNYGRWLGCELGLVEPDCDVATALERSIALGSHLMTGGPFSNVAGFSERFEGWTVQGGYVPPALMPSGKVLEKFADREFVATYNLGGSNRASWEPLIEGRVTANLVGKNVCHGFVAGEHEVNLLWEGEREPSGFRLFVEGLKRNVEKSGKPKALHDLLAFALALDPGLGDWIRGRPVRKKGQWSFVIDDASKVQACIGHESFAVIIDTLVGSS